MIQFLRVKVHGIRLENARIKHHHIRTEDFNIKSHCIKPRRSCHQEQLKLVTRGFTIKV